MDKLESMVLEAETVSALMIQMADDDVGDTSFAVMSDLGENGTEHDCDLGVHETALRASAVIDAMLAELEAKDKRIAELSVGKVGNALLERENHHVEVVDKLLERIADLEAKLATPVRLPTKYSMLHREDFHSDYQSKMVFKADEVIAALREHGFTVERDE